MRPWGVENGLYLIYINRKKKRIDYELEAIYSSYLRTADAA